MCFIVFVGLKKTCCSLQSKSAIDAIEQNLYVATRERNHSVCLVWELAPATKELGEGFSPSSRLYFVSTTYGSTATWTQSQIPTSCESQIIQWLGLNPKAL